MSTNFNLFTKFRNPPSLKHGEKLLTTLHCGNCIFMPIISKPRGSDRFNLKILKYNFDSQIIEKTFKYPFNIALCSFHFSMDKETRIIYMLWQKNGSHGAIKTVLVSCNMNNNKWKVLSKQEWNKVNGFHFIASPVSALHVTCKDHYYYDTKNNKLTKFGNSG